jgi:hypothetical protein
VVEVSKHVLLLARQQKQQQLERDADVMLPLLATRKLAHEKTLKKY